LQDRQTVIGLRCRECGKNYPKDPIAICGECFGPLEAVYDYEQARKILTREALAKRPRDLWRYRELLPVDGPPRAGKGTGCTPLIRADRLAKRLGLRELYLKNDTVNYPSLSFKDRVVATAIAKALEFGFDTVGCASTGNLANAVAAQAAACGLKSYIFIPHDLESTKVLGTLVYGANVVAIDGIYDQVNRLCSEISDAYGWAIVNVNLRPYYGEGSKSMGFEIAEDLGWKIPRHVVAPMAGGSLITKIEKAFTELSKIGLAQEQPCRFYGAQAAGCAPIVNAVRSKANEITPVRPNTIVKSLAIGDPADGYYALNTIRRSGGWGAAPSDEQVVEAIRMLAETEGIFAETAGGVTLAAARILIEEGKLPRDESVVLCITGNGLKTAEVIRSKVAPMGTIPPTLGAFQKLVPTPSRSAAADR
jgi:threonine synthase